LKKPTPTELIIVTTDRRYQKLVFRLFVCAGENEISNGNPDNHQTLVDVRLSKGDGLEFKRCYDEIIKRLSLGS